MISYRMETCSDYSATQELQTTQTIALWAIASYTIQGVIKTYSQHAEQAPRQP